MERDPSIFSVPSYPKNEASSSRQLFLSRLKVLCKVCSCISISESEVSTQYDARVISRGVVLNSGNRDLCNPLAELGYVTGDGKCVLVGTFFVSCRETKLFSLNFYAFSFFLFFVLFCKYISTS